MTTYGLTYHLGASVTVVVEAEDEGEAAVIARDLAAERLALADEALAAASSSVSLIGEAYLVDVDEVTP